MTMRHYVRESDYTRVTDRSMMLNTKGLTPHPAAAEQLEAKFKAVRLSPKAMRARMKMVRT